MNQLMKGVATTASDSQDFSELVARAQSGDRQAQGELLEPLRGFLRMLAIRQLDARLSGRIDASDIVHETYITALASLEQFRGSERPQFLAWLRTVHEHVVQNLAREHIVAQKRSVTRQRPITDSQFPQLAALIESTPSGQLMQAELILQLIHALDKLPSDQREAIRLRFFEGRTRESIAEEMQRSVQSVAGLLKRGIFALRNQICPPNGDSSVTSPDEEPRP
jgi:RNA polymerase sigma-70 factor (ECF subfamily)